MQLLISPIAAQDLEDIGDYIAQDNARRAVSFLAELQAQCETICSQPQAYRKRLELGAQIRSCAYGNYVIFFTHSSTTVTIVRILHGARDTGSANIHQS